MFPVRAPKKLQINWEWDEVHLVRVERLAEPLHLQPEQSSHCLKGFSIKTSERFPSGMLLHLPVLSYFPGNETR